MLCWELRIHEKKSPVLLTSFLHATVPFKQTSKQTNKQISRIHEKKSPILLTSFLHATVPFKQTYLTYLNKLNKLIVQKGVLVLKSGQRGPPRGIPYPPQTCTGLQRESYIENFLYRIPAAAPCMFGGGMGFPWEAPFGHFWGPRHPFGRLTYLTSCIREICLLVCLLVCLNGTVACTLRICEGRYILKQGTARTLCYATAIPFYYSILFYAVDCYCYCKCYY